MGKRFEVIYTTSESDGIKTDTVYAKNTGDAYLQFNRRMELENGTFDVDGINEILPKNIDYDNDYLKYEW